MPDDKRALESFCPKCGLKISKQSAPGSITGYMFDPVKCKCLSEGAGAGPGATFQIPGSKDLTFGGITTQSASELNLEEGTVVGGNYSIGKLIGHGGMGVVYQATHIALGKRCAVKLMPPGQVTSEAWSRFQLEAKSVAKLEHKNIVKVTDLGLHKGYMPFYAMEYIEGQSLAERINRGGKLTIEEAIKIFTQVCDGVDYAHRAGIFHRDLKPANIMLGKDGVKILDFGLAKLAHTNRAEQSLTAVGDIFGSPYYMSPEQCAGQKIDNRSDIYSIGCALFECLTGRPPFHGNLSSAVIRAQQESPPPTLESILGKGVMPDSMEIIIAKLLRKNPVERYQTCRELSNDLQRVAQGEKVDPVYVSRAAKVASTSKASTDDEENSGFAPLAITIATVVAITSIIGVASFIYFTKKAPPNTPPIKDAGPDVITKTPIIKSVPVEENIKMAPSARDRSFYSTVDKHDPSRIVFNFPTDVRIGNISSSAIENIPAVGKVTTKRTGLAFGPNEVTIAYPQYMSRFRPGEVNHLTFSAFDMGDSEGSAERERRDINTCCRVLTYLPDWQNLPELTFEQLRSTLTPQSLKILQSLKAVRSISIYGRESDCKNLAQTPMMKTAISVHLAFLTDYQSMLEGMDGGKKPVSLTIDKGAFSEPELQALMRLQNLQGLSLDYQKLTVQDLERLTVLKNVERLTIPYNILQDRAAVVALKQFPKLKVFFAVEVPGSAMYREKSLAKELPGVKVVFHRRQSEREE